MATLDRESDLYPPVKAYLQRRGYQVQGEVRGCDIVATAEDELLVVELKKNFSLALLAQAVERQEYADGVYVAVGIESATEYPRNYKNVRRLLRRLEVGLLIVRFLTTGTRVELVFHPDTYEGRRRKKKRIAVIREVEGRLVDGGAGGRASREGVQLTAYRQAAIHLALLLRSQGESSPAQLRKLGGPERAQSILRNNHYGWFDRVDHGIYRLSPAGEESLEALGPVAEEIAEQLG